MQQHILIVTEEDIIVEAKVILYINIDKVEISFLYNGITYTSEFQMIITPENIDYVLTFAKWEVKEKLSDILFEQEVEQLCKKGFI